MRIFSSMMGMHLSHIGLAGPASAAMKAAIAGSVDILLFA